MDLISTYINRGRFGEFVTSFLEGENERKKEEAEKDDDLKLWIMYVRIAPEESFFDWKKRVLNIGNGKNRSSRGNDLTDEGIKEIVDGLFAE